MNCKQGDLAVVVRSSCGNEGRIVRCVRLVLGGRFDTRTGSKDLGPAWVVEHSGLVSWRGRPVTHAPDSHLRPIRDNDGEDETLTWAGKPADATRPTEAA